MKIMVVGCGKVGLSVIKSLIAEGHDLTVMDNDPSVISEVTNIYDVMTICGSGTDYEALTEAEVDTAELFIAVTGSDEFNMLSCFLAKKMGTSHTVARIRNPEYNAKKGDILRKELGVSHAVNPELSAAREMLNVLKLPSAVKVETFSRGNFEMVEIVIKEKTPLDNVSLIELRKKYTEKFLVCAVEREERVYIPDGNFVLKSGDKIGLLASPTEIQRLLKQLGILKKQARNVMILGASRTAYYLAKMLIESGNSVKIVEINHDRCIKISETLPEAVVINGDGASRELLLEEGIANVDAFVSLTGDDEKNILLSYFALEQNVPKVITKVNRDEYFATAEKLGLETIITPRSSISSIAVRYARAIQNSMGSKVETLYKLMDAHAEALEFIAAPDCEIIGVPFKSLHTKSNVLVGGIIRGRRAIIPNGDDCIMLGDRVVVISTGNPLADLEDIVER